MSVLYLDPKSFCRHWGLNFISKAQLLLNRDCVNVHLFLSFCVYCMWASIWSGTWNWALVRHYEPPCCQVYTAQKQAEGLQEKACDFGHEKGLMTLYKPILQAQGTRFSPGVGLVLSGLPTQGWFGARDIWVPLIRHRVNALLKNM